MSGYLHRLVHTVSQPRQTVHPRTGSIFAPYRGTHDSSPGFFEQTETVTSHPARSEFPKTFQPAEPARRPTPLLFEPAVKPPHAEGMPPANNQSERAVHVPQPLAASQQESAARDSAPEAPIENYDILIHSHSSEAGSATPQAPRLFAEAITTRDSKPNAPAARTTRAERRPDEIQIHIGRIEVTAVQPPAPPPQKTRDHGISLDAYLARRNGRSR